LFCGVGVDPVPGGAGVALGDEEWLVEPLAERCGLAEVLPGAFAKVRGCQARGGPSGIDCGEDAQRELLDGEHQGGVEAEARGRGRPCRARERRRR
jgi:hypothetical protein